MWFQLLVGYRITMDTAKECTIISKLGEQAFKFKKYRDGLYHYTVPFTDVSTQNKPKQNKLRTILCNRRQVIIGRSYFTTAKMKGADRTREIQLLVGWPGTTSWKFIDKIDCNGTETLL